MTMAFVAGVARAIPIAALGFPRIPVLIALVFELIFPPFVLIWHAMALKAEAITAAPETLRVLQAVAPPVQSTLPKGRFPRGSAVGSKRLCR